MKRMLIALAALAALAAGCSKLTPENYAKIKLGMTYDEVKAILGGPDKCSDSLGVKSCTWGDEKKYISVKFAGEKVMFLRAENVR